MAVGFDTLSLLTNPITRRVFGMVVKSRSIRFEQLVKQVEADVDRDRAKRTLQELIDAHLIKQKGSAVEDFATYYVTADGLEASRRVGI